MQRIGGSGRGPDRAPSRVLTTTGPVAVLHADLDGDGTLDLALLDLSTGGVVVWTGEEAGFQRASRRAEAEVAGGWVAERLTRREQEVATLLEAGYTDREIAGRLGIGRRTAESHAASVLSKLGLRSRRELIRRLWGRSPLA